MRPARPYHRAGPQRRAQPAVPPRLKRLPLPAARPSLHPIPPRLTDRPARLGRRRGAGAVADSLPSSRSCPLVRSAAGRRRPCASSAAGAARLCSRRADPTARCCRPGPTVPAGFPCGGPHALPSLGPTGRHMAGRHGMRGLAGRVRASESLSGSGVSVMSRVTPRVYQLRSHFS